MDGDVVRTLDRAPDVPVQLELGVLDFPDRFPEVEHTPEPAVSQVIGRPLG